MYYYCREGETLSNDCSQNATNIDGSSRDGCNEEKQAPHQQPTVLCQWRASRKVLEFPLPLAEELYKQGLLDIISTVTIHSEIEGYR